MYGLHGTGERTLWGAVVWLLMLNDAGNVWLPGVVQKALVAINEVELKLSSSSAEVSVAAARPSRWSCKIDRYETRALLSL